MMSTVCSFSLHPNINFDLIHFALFKDNIAKIASHRFMITNEREKKNRKTHPKSNLHENIHGIVDAHR